MFAFSCTYTYLNTHTHTHTHAHKYTNMNTHIVTTPKTSQYHKAKIIMVICILFVDFHTQTFAERNVYPVLQT